MVHLNPSVMTRDVYLIAVPTNHFKQWSKCL